MQAKTFYTAREDEINEWLAHNIGRGVGPDDHGKQIKFITQSESQESDGIISFTVIIWYE
jgi:hypothetical protein